MYQSEYRGKHYELGTSGFLYRSNKLMYDLKTQSLWSTLLGKPVVGELVDKNIELQRGYLVTSTWGEWRRQHPDTSVLSMETGYRRNYGEGIAYSRYFGTDRLMFTVPIADDRLKNKAEVVALRNHNEQLAISSEFLDSNIVYNGKLGSQTIVVLTDQAGGNRVFESKGIQFVSWNQMDQAVDSDGSTWSVTEEKLVQGKNRLPRLPSHRAFWFGWHAQFPETQLVK